MYFLQLLKKEKIKKFLLKINKAQIFDGRFVLTDENRESQGFRFYQTECVLDRLSNIWTRGNFHD
jgi:hypothetical protein